MHFLCRLKSFGATLEILNMFFCSTIQTVLQHCITAWYNTQYRQKPGCQVC